MSNVSYAPNDSGPYAGSIGWINFPSQPLVANDEINVTNTLRDGETISFTLRNIRNPLGPTTLMAFVGANAPVQQNLSFGKSSYDGIKGPVILYSSNSDTFNNFISFDNITVKDSSGAEIYNYTIVLADGEGTGLNETIQYKTDGSFWNDLGDLGIAGSPVYSGINTDIVNSQGVTLPSGVTSYNSKLLATHDPKNIRVNIVNSYSGREGIAFGIILTKIRIEKDITSRAYPNDQFSLLIRGIDQSSAVTTEGNTTGIQDKSPILYLKLNKEDISTFGITETMAYNSTGDLYNDYKTIVENYNLTPGGSPISINGNLNEVISLRLGDSILVKITNTAIKTSLKITKESCDCIYCIGSKIPYNITVTNTGSTIINDIVVEDILPDSVYIHSMVATVGNISKSNNKVTWIIPELQADSKAKAMIIIIATDKICYNSNGFIINKSNIISYNSTNVIKPIEDVVITHVDCCCCRQKNNR